jgi:hypothetical protein
VGNDFSLLVISLAERGGHGDLRDSDHLSVIPYVHGGTKLYCAQACLVRVFSFSDPRE